MEINTWLKYLLISSIIGVIVETGAFIMHWWILNPWWFFIPWGIIWEGLCFGTLAYFIKKYHHAIQYVISASVGGLGEVIVAIWIPLWQFPNERFLFLNGLPAIIMALTVVWGFFCPLLNVFMKQIFKIEEND
ncbi:MAG: hypothetical protein HWN67_18685 [Candidatus Helarchaeota archaeon]|nr:hypothetical protein [Candidatus Helarchaeota archaeon]